MAFDLVISLGFRCFTGFQLRRMMIQTISFPLDWVVSDANGAIEAIATKFSGTMQPENLFSHPHYVLDRRFRFQHWHDFSNKADPLSCLSQTTFKRAFLEQRFFEVLHSRRRLLFVRHEVPGHGSRDIAQRFVNALRLHRPDHSFKFLYLSDQIDDFETDYIVGVHVPRNKHLPQHVWDGAFGYVHDRERISGYSPRMVRACAKLPVPIQINVSKIVGSTRKRKIQLELYASRLISRGNKTGQPAGEKSERGRSLSPSL